MAEEDAEIALLHKMQADLESAGGEDGGAHGAADGELPSTTENINKQEKKENVADDQVLRALSPSASGAVSGGGDPSVPAVMILGQGDSRSSSRASARKPKTVGGFIADDSDEEYDAATPEITTSLQPSASNTPNRAVAPSPLQNSVSQGDLKRENQNNPTLGVSTSNTLSVNPSIGGVTPSVQTSLQVLTSTAPVPSVPKARLPHDKVGIMEDRIKEDPRGDIDAWLSLIAEHRSRNKLDDARAIYQRFFQNFPQAVSLTGHLV
jgi:cleavage stimulation factor subunit 3